MKDWNKHLQLLGKVLSKEASEQEKEALSQWAQEDQDHQQVVDETTLIWDKAEDALPPVRPNKAAAWERLQAQLESAAPATPAPKTTIKPLWYQLAAAVLVVAVGLGWWYQQTLQTASDTLTPQLASITTEAGGQQEVRLPDGSKVMLNEKSTLQYASNFEPRTVQLTGEAFFEVVKKEGQPFEIITAKTKTTVLGTSFNVRAYHNQATEIAVVTGKVAFETLTDPEQERVLLLPQEVGTHQDNKGIVKTIQKGNNVLAWKTKQLNFENQALSEVLPILERYYGIAIEGSESLLNCHYTGNFEQAELEEVLNTIAFTFPNGMNIEKTNDKYILTGQGCD
jgi:ferric-dicitrate binding protein FerR (iron transport regulator)